MHIHASHVLNVCVAIYVGLYCHTTHTLVQSCMYTPPAAALARQPDEPASLSAVGAQQVILF